MSDRLKELQRQRALTQEQLAWLDREIARETGQVSAMASVPEARPAATVTRQTAPDILSRYTQEAPGDMAHNAKRGCWIAFAAVVLGFAVLVGAAYLLYRSPN